MEVSSERTNDTIFLSDLKPLNIGWLPIFLPVLTWYTNESSHGKIRRVKVIHKPIDGVLSLGASVAM
jgi:hypothetical protein